MANAPHTAGLPSSGLDLPTAAASHEALQARDLLLKKISVDGNLPAIGSLILRVVQLASANDEAVHNLATFVLSDVALTQKILRIANTAGYRPSGGKQITTISRAIFVLGFETIKTTALALLLVDSMAGRRGESVRAELAQALAASAVAREVARRSQYRDTEEAAVAALFRNVGQVLVASYDHPSYQQIETLVKAGRTAQQAANQVLGCSYTLLAEAVLRDWRIPESIVHGILPLPVGPLKPAKVRSEWMQQVAGFSSAAAQLVLRPATMVDMASCQTILARYAPALQLDYQGLLEILAAARRETRLLSGSVNLVQITEGLSDAQTGVTLSAGVAGSASIAEAEADADAFDREFDAVALTKGAGKVALPHEFLLSVAPSAAVLSEERYASGKPLNAREFLLSGVQDASEMMASGRCKLNDLIMLVLETLHQGLGCRFATICLKDTRSAQFRARISVGEQMAEKQAGFRFAADGEPDLFTLAMANDADLIIADAQHPKILALLPAWHRELLPDTRSFIVLPLVVRDQPVGFFYADRRRPADEGLQNDETSLIKTLKGQVLMALNQHAG